MPAFAANGIGKLPRKYAPGILTQPAGHSTISTSPKSHKFIREVIIMSLRKVAGAIALLALISVIGGGGNRYLCPDYALELR